MIITGAPVENLDFDRGGLLGRSCARSWPGPAPTSTPPSTSAGELRPGCTTTTAFPSTPCPKSSSASLPIRVLKTQSPLFRGFDDIFYVPHSRYTENRLERHPGRTPELELLAVSGRGRSVRGQERGTTAGSSSPATRSTTRTRWPRSTSGTWTRACPSRVPRQLLPRRRPQPPARGALALRRPAVLHQLAELLRLPDHALRSSRDLGREMRFQMYTSDFFTAPPPNGGRCG